jgi:hypothetical protein
MRTGCIYHTAKSVVLAIVAIIIDALGERYTL